jgi:hypothetical protein
LPWTEHDESRPTQHRSASAHFPSLFLLSGLMLFSDFGLNLPSMPPL